MLASSGHNDVLRTYFVSQRDGVDYNLAYIGADFSAPKTGEFDQAYMRALYAYGLQEGQGRPGLAQDAARPRSALPLPSNSHTRRMPHDTGQQHFLEKVPG